MRIMSQLKSPALVPADAGLWHACDGATVRRIKASDLLRFHVVDRSIGEAVVMKKPHLLVKQAVDHVGSGVLPPDEPEQLPVQRRAQIHRPVVAVQHHLQKQKSQSMMGRCSNTYQNFKLKELRDSGTNI